MTAPGPSLRILRTRVSADLRADLDRLGVDLAQQPVDLPGVDHPGAEVLNRLGSAGHAVAQALDRGLPGVASRDVPGQERVPGPDSRPRLLLLDGHPEQR